LIGGEILRRLSAVSPTFFSHQRQLEWREKASGVVGDSLTTRRLRFAKIERAARRRNGADVAPQKGASPQARWTTVVFFIRQ
jgi:hypothetical protein